MNISNTIYYGISHLYNKKRFFWVSLMVMVTGMILIYNTFIVYFGSYSDIVKERKLLGSLRAGLYKVNSTYYTIDFSYYDVYLDFLREVKNDYKIGGYQLTGDSFAASFDENELHEMKRKFSDTFDSTEDTLIIPILRIDDFLLEKISFKDVNDCEIELNIDEKGREEIAIGRELAPFLEIGDELVDSHRNIVYVVKYILKDDQKWADGELLNNTDIISLNHCIVTPLCLETCDVYDCASFANNTFLYVGDEKESDVEKIIYMINKQAEEKGVYIDIYSMDEMEKISLKDNNDEFRFCLVLVGLMVLTVTVIIIILSILSWVSDYHDIGILYANGFSNIDIFRIILMENLFKLVMAIVLSTAWIYIKNGNDLLIEYAYYLDNGIAYVSILIIYFVVLMFSSIVSFILINRISPTNLLKGEQL